MCHKEKQDKFVKLLNHGWCLRERPARSSRGQDCWTRLQCATRASGRRPQPQANGREGVLPESQAGGLHWTGSVKLQVSESDPRVLISVPPPPVPWALCISGGGEGQRRGPRARGAGVQTSWPRVCLNTAVGEC